MVAAWWYAMERSMERSAGPGSLVVSSRIEDMIAISLSFSSFFLGIRNDCGNFSVSIPAESYRVDGMVFVRSF